MAPETINTGKIKDGAVTLDKLNASVLGPVMDYIGQTSKDSHRALDTCHEIVAVTAYLIKRQIGVHMEEESPGVLSRWLSRNFKPRSTLQPLWK